MRCIGFYNGCDCYDCQGYNRPQYVKTKREKLEDWIAIGVIALLIGSVLICGGALSCLTK